MRAVALHADRARHVAHPITQRRLGAAPPASRQVIVGAGREAPARRGSHDTRDADALGHEVIGLRIDFAQVFGADVAARARPANVGAEHELPAPTMTWRLVGGAAPRRRW